MSAPPVRRILVATDRSETAETAVSFAEEMARRYDAELIVLQVLVPDEARRGRPGNERGAAGRTRVVVNSDPAKAIVEAAREESADVLVVGNVGLRSRRRFLVGNVPSAVAHSAPCTVILVDTSGDRA
jgi:nucleotide-binding universal stress UspA family protein